MKEFLSEHWILLYSLFIYVMGFWSGYSRDVIKNKNDKYTMPNKSHKQAGVE